MLIDAQRSTLIVCDLQTRLLPALADGDATVERCAWLMDIAARLVVPMALPGNRERRGSTSGPSPSG